MVEFMSLKKANASQVMKYVLLKSILEIVSHFKGRREAG